MPRSEFAFDRNSGNHSPQNTAVSRHLLENLQELNFSHLLYFWTVARDGSIASACEKLHVSQPTVSMQVRKLERTLGHRLFDRSGRNLVLTDVGRTVFDYADEMFSLGRELLGTLRGLPGKRSARLHVGIPTFLPELITYRLLEPVLKIPENVRLVCHEGDLNELVAGLERHRFDAILTDRPIQATTSVRTFNHPLGECGVALCGVSTLAQRAREGFPGSLEGIPLLLPTAVSDLRYEIDRWFDTLPFSPRIVGEFDDSTLMREFAGGGNGLFPVPMAVLPEILKRYGVEFVAQLPNLRSHYFVVTTERKLTHPAIVLIAQTARGCVLGSASESAAPA